MKQNILLTLAFALFTLVQSIAQEKSFEEKAKILSDKIEQITLKEKALLKKDIKAIDKQYNNDEITFEEAEQRRKDAALKHANIIKQNIETVEKQVHNLVQHKVDSIVDNEPKSSIFLEIGSNGIKIRNSKFTNKRTYSYTVLAFGLNNLTTGSLNSIQASNFEFGGSQFFEFGINYKTRMFKKSNLFYINYGLSARYNKLQPKNNQYFTTTGNLTSLQTSTLDLKRVTFKNVQLVVPIFFELDFTKTKMEKEKVLYRRNKTWRFGVGGFAGINLKSKQILRFKENERRKKTKEKGDFNVNNFVYGLQGQIGYKDTSFYVMYDLNDLFQNSFTNQKNISFGIRFDL